MRPLSDLCASSFSFSCSSSPPLLASDVPSKRRYLICDSLKEMTNGGGDGDKCLFLLELYQDDETVTLWVNKVGPYNNPQETYNYYSLPFCHPPGNPAHKWGGLGEVLGGNELIDSQLEIKFKRDVERTTICEIELEAAKVKQFKDAIDNSYWFEFLWIHWFSVFNSFMMVIFLTGLVSMILMRTLRNDYAKYAREDDDLETLERDVNEESGWKLVHGDVFRPSQNLALLSAVVGTGEEQLSQPSLSVMLLRHFIAGYVSGGMYSRNGAAIPFGTMVVVFIIWAFISFPLALLGTVVGRNWSGAPNNPCRVKTIPRPIPEKKWYLTPSVISLMGGLLPFGSIFIEMYFVFTSFWNYKVYYVYGFMLLVFVILIIVTVCVTIVGTYFLLNAENYQWQWTSFFSAASTALYVYLYSIYYYHVKTKMSGFFQTAFTLDTL
ncbi:Transmembrane 9 superfamily member 1 [Sesamum angolense]|uniref:Transmembrane 9 superfamily member n=1 Tax=Sesamum angolense TaxID=2727404 RepID=A0AAE1WDC0_9LAMI|nr:Transmembrane 9 superfamily member 1 [Sesamum angolense]